MGRPCRRGLPFHEGPAGEVCEAPRGRHCRSLSRSFTWARLSGPLTGQPCQWWERGAGTQAHGSKAERSGGANESAADGRSLTGSSVSPGVWHPLLGTQRSLQTLGHMVAWSAHRCNIKSQMFQEADTVPTFLDLAFPIFDIRFDTSLFFSLKHNKS